MSITTYAELQAQVQKWIDRNDPEFIAEIPGFISLAESEIDRLLRTYKMTQKATSSTTAGSAYVELPDDFAGLKNIQLNTDPVSPLTRMSREEIDFHYGGVSGKPQAFAINGGELELAPTPDSDYTLQITYTKTIPNLTDTNTSNWLLLAHSDIYLYGVMAYATAYVKDFQATSLWESKFYSGMERLNDTSRKDEWSGSVLTMRPA